MEWHVNIQIRTVDDSTTDTTTPTTYKSGHLTSF